MKYWDGSSECPVYSDLLSKQRGQAFDIGANGGFVTNMFADGSRRSSPWNLPGVVRATGIDRRTEAERRRSSDGGERPRRRGHL
jgi:hypothetical protein